VSVTPRAASPTPGQGPPTPRPRPIERIGEFWGHAKTREFGGRLIDLEEDGAARAVFGLVREMERNP
jgi:hypothetical protein